MPTSRNNNTITTFYASEWKKGPRFGGNRRYTSSSSHAKGLDRYILALGNTKNLFWGFNIFIEKYYSNLFSTIKYVSNRESSQENCPNPFSSFPFFFWSHKSPANGFPHLPPSVGFLSTIFWCFGKHKLWKPRETKKKERKKLIVSAGASNR